MYLKQLNSSNFNVVEFDHIKMQAGLPSFVLKYNRMYPVRDNSLVEKKTSPHYEHPVGMQFENALLHTYGMPEDWVESIFFLPSSHPYGMIDNELKMFKFGTCHVPNYLNGCYPIPVREYRSVETNVSHHILHTVGMRPCSEIYAGRIPNGMRRCRDYKDFFLPSDTFLRNVIRQYASGNKKLYVHEVFLKRKLLDDSSNPAHIPAINQGVISASLKNKGSVTKVLQKIISTKWVHFKLSHLVIARAKPEAIQKINKMDCFAASGSQ